MTEDFKMIEFNCNIKMQVKMDYEMTEGQIKEAIGANFDFVTEYGSEACEYTDEFSAYILLDNIENIKLAK